MNVLLKGRHRAANITEKLKQFAS